MSRAAELREYWEGRIPAGASIMYLADAERFINRDLPVPVISLRTLQRRAETGDLRCIGGASTPLREYRVLRSALIEFLCTLDVLTAPARSVRSSSRKRSKAAAAKAARAARTAQRQSLKNQGQANLFGDDS